MKLVFAHDHTFFEYDDVFYSTGGLSKVMLERYTSVFEEVQVLSRQKKLDELSGGLTLSSTKNVSFTEIPNFKSLKNYKKIFEAKKIIKNEVLKADVVIARLPSSIGSLAIAIAKRNNIPYLIEVVACPWDAHWNHSLKGKLIAPSSYFKMRRFVKDSRFTIYVTESFLQTRYPTKGMQTNCSNVELLESNERTLEKRNGHILSKKDDSTIVIGTIGAVSVKHKGQQYVIKALGELKSKGITNFQYELLGGGDTKFLKSIAKKHGVSEQVKFLGIMSHEKVFEWLDTIDIYSQPSRQEGLPRALIEAMSRAVPAFGAKTAGIPELLDSEFIFSNTKDNITEICNILETFDKNIMLKQAKRNYEESKNYNKTIIDKRRRDFLIKFKDESVSFIKRKDVN